LFVGISQGAAKFACKLIRGSRLNKAAGKSVRLGVRTFKQQHDCIVATTRKQVSAESQVLVADFLDVTLQLPGGDGLQGRIFFFIDTRGDRPNGVDTAANRDTPKEKERCPD
jgi:hypothetical protein